MTIAAEDVIILETKVDLSSSSSYVGSVKTYIANTLYILTVGSKDDVAAAKPDSVATTGVTWVEIVPTGTTIDSGRQQTCYKAVPTAGTSAATTVNFDSDQTKCTWNIKQIANVDTSGVNGANAVAQAKADSQTGNTFSLTLGSTVGTGNLVLCGLWGGSIVTWTAGAGQTGLTTQASSVNYFEQYNLSELETVEAATSSSVLKIGTVIEIVARTSPTLTLPTVTAESTTELSGTVTCSTDGDDLFWYVSLSAIAPSEADLIAGTDSVADGTQAISASGEQTVASFGSSFDPATTYYVYYLAQDTNGNSNIAATSPITTAGVVTLHTLELIDKTTIVAAADGFTTDERYEILVPGDTDFQAIGAADDEIGTVFIATGAGSGTGTAYHVIPCICESTDFTLGVTAELWPAGVENDKEVATLVEAIDTAPTSTPQYNITFSVAPDDVANDIVNIIYDAAVGDMKSVTGGIALASDAGFNDATHTC